MPPPPIVKVEKMETTEAAAKNLTSAENKDEAFGNAVSAIKLEENGTSVDENDLLGFDFGNK